jgi:hypothetical protein
MNAPSRGFMPVEGTNVSMQSASVIAVNGKVYLWGIVENDR